MVSLYTADYVLTQNDSRDIHRDAAVAVEDGKILSVGHADLLEIIFPDHRRVDLGNAVIMPGLVNAHTHVSMSLLRGYSDDKALMDWLTQDIFPAEAKLTPELVELGAMFSLAEMIRTGTTGMNHEHHHVIEYSLKLDSNPEFTSSVLVAFARAIHRMRERGMTGCKTVFDVAPADLSPLSPEELRAHLL